MIDLGLGNNVLYTAFQLEAMFEDARGGQVRGHATAFFVKRDDGRLFLVTNRHAVDGEFRGTPGHSLVLMTLRGFDYDTLTKADQPLMAVSKGVPLASFPGEESLDIACLDASQFAVVSGPTHIKGSIGSDLLASAPEFDDSIRAGDFLLAPGYLLAHGVRAERPVFMVGIVASDPRFAVQVEISGLPRTQDVVLYQSLSRAGMSGSPVFATQRGLKLGQGLSGPPSRDARLVGVNCGHFEDHKGLPLQYSYFVRSDHLLALVNAIP